MWLLVNQTKATNILYQNISFNSGQLRNNTVNSAMSITINCVIEGRNFHEIIKLTPENL